ncbi:hypothetical protein CONPUDRAFT_155525 [Coniophora puteana RWD-64-598 SS2]|uniref:Uncharacterized protein n=1 Tax=Coniophora puteana (strain RWD-64-598) TaxID=741705 RepID=A0A5M3MHU2_CONPW|nr:uncharacterized protein CONPUDRAFT_155525 [Coniophora puteana RWD-64-598 SS2]EIW78798.1 hypothetical protein CONPUDRAFT_155525 [Coniophora puteana RWD-64-598 SS2]
MGDSHQHPNAHPPDFVHASCTSPLWRPHESAKVRSRMVKYGVEKTGSLEQIFYCPVHTKLPVGQLHKFACGQLDHLDKCHPPSSKTVHDDSTSNHQMPAQVRIGMAL